MRLSVLLLAATACGTYSNYKTTRIAKPGTTDVLMGLQVSGGGTQGKGAELGDREVLAPLPELVVDVRQAVKPTIEAQLNFTMTPVKGAMTGSAEAAGKIRLWERGRWSLATGAGLSYRVASIGGGVIEGVIGSVPVICGVDLGRHQLVVSVTGGYQRWYASGANPVGAPFIGESIGFLWQIGKRWALLPEAGSAWTPTANIMTDNSKIFHVGVAAVWTR